MKAAYSQREKNLIITLGFKDLLQEKDPKVTYSTLALFCFSCGMAGPVADSVRRCYNAIIEGKPIRFTGAFDTLIKLPTTAWARDNRNYCVMEVDSAIGGGGDSADEDCDKDSDTDSDEDPDEDSDRDSDKYPGKDSDRDCAEELEISPPENSSPPELYNTESRTIPVYRPGVRLPKRPSPF